MITEGFAELPAREQDPDSTPAVGAHGGGRPDMSIGASALW
ncbi:hypothetical protein [Embleya sp. NPDC020886]